MPEPHTDRDADSMTRASGANLDALALADIGEAMMLLKREVQRLRDRCRDLESASGHPDAPRRVARSDGDLYARLQHRMYRINR